MNAKSLLIASMAYIQRNDTKEYLLTDGCDAYYWGANLEQALLMNVEDIHLLMKELGYKNIAYSVVEV